jgi:hypothetical protein
MPSPRPRSPKLSGASGPLDPLAQRDELAWGPSGDMCRDCRALCLRDHRDPPEDLSDDEAEEWLRRRLPVTWDHGRDCGCTSDRSSPLCGFHADGSPCYSRFASPDDREAAWRVHGRALLRDFRRLGLAADEAWALRVYGQPG